MVYIRERPNIRIGINNFCKEHNISVADMYVDQLCSSSIRKQLRKMLDESGELQTAELRKIMKNRED